MNISTESKVKAAYLLLEDGTVFEGYSMGKQGTAIGEVIFNTNMTTYQDLCKDPTYCGQIVAQTYPLIGNRGVDPDAASKLQANGYIVREWCVEPTDADEFVTLDVYLKQASIVGLCGIDTRSLTRHIRKNGVMNGAITDNLDNKESLLKDIKDYRVPPSIGRVTTSKPYSIKSEKGLYKIAVPDYGFNTEFLKFLTDKGCDVMVYPAYASAKEILSSNPDGIMLSDGPGDPWDNPEIIEIIKELISTKKPVLGLGLGHQLLGVANGFEIIKLAVGHRGSNQPVKDINTGKIMTTSQNHGYAVDINSVDENIAEVNLININDKTCEGLLYKNFPGITVQFEPTDGLGWQDTAWVFESYINMLKK